MEPLLPPQEEPVAVEPKKERLLSLDILRGLDMFALTVIAPLVYAINDSVGVPKWLLHEFNHYYGGFTFLDIIMPLFIFMCGAAVPFGLGRRCDEGRATVDYWKHVLSRFALLWFLGMIAQGRLLTYDVTKISPFNNTLQTIACGYLIASFVYLIKAKWIRRAIPVLLALGYAAWMHLGGDYSRGGNVAIQFEKMIVPMLTPADSRALQLADPWYSWWATIPMFGAMTLCGMEATLILTAKEGMLRRYWKLLGLGFGLLVAGLVAGHWIPVIKHVFTFSFTAQAMGWSCLSLALLFCLTDVIGFRNKWFWWILVLYGQTALLAYFLVEMMGGIAFGFAHAVTKHLPEPGALGPAVKEWMPVLQWFASSVFVTVVLCYRRRARAAVKD